MRTVLRLALAFSSLVCFVRAQTPAAEEAAYISNRMKDCGILIGTEGPLHNVLKIRPPMVFTEADSDFLLETLDGIFEDDFLNP